MRKPIVVLMLLLVCVNVLNVTAGDLFLFNHRERDRPPMPKPGPAEQLAKEIDWLEAHLETYGTIVAKQPDVWGEARLTRHREEFEAILRQDKDNFRETLNGSMRRTDQALLAMAFALNGQAQSGTEPNSIVQTVIPNEGTPATLQPPEGPKAAFIPFDESQTGNLTLSLEPTTFLAQKSRYLNYLHELRRINEGDDTSDSPGYAMYLFRIPVSVLPGKKTDKGYGAEISFSINPYLSTETLPRTFRDLVVNDIVDHLAPVMVNVVNDAELVKELKSLLEDAESNSRKRPITSEDARSSPEMQKAFDNYKNQQANDARRMASMKNKLTMRAAPVALNYSSLPTRRKSFAFPHSQMVDIYGEAVVIGHVATGAFDALRSLPNTDTYTHLPDVQGYLRTELEAAYQFLDRENPSLWQHCNPELVAAIRERRRDISEKEFTRSIFHETDALERSTIDQLKTNFFDDIKRHYPRAAHTVTVSLAWAIIVEAALLNEHLIADMRESAIAKGCSCAIPEEGWREFYVPRPNEEDCHLFNEYIQCRWPIHVFALDPITDDQNIADFSATRRDMQIAAAISLANGSTSTDAALNFMRQIEVDIETIQLNRTQIGFSHGADTFGWRFMPRFQTYPPQNNLHALKELVWGGPTQHHLLKERRLEPAMRECVAIVLLPSFVPYVTLDSRVNWFALTNPRHRELSLADAMHLSRSYEAVRSNTQALRCGHLYRPGDTGRLLRAIEQIDRKMPLQTTLLSVPNENTHGGFEIFSSGVTDFGPELDGWYGEPHILIGEANATSATHKDPICQDCAGTTVFLVGDQFSVHDTQVIAGGRLVPHSLLSRQLMRVVIPPTATTITNASGTFVDVHIATPYGVSAHLFIPAEVLPKKAPAAAPPPGSGLSWAGNLKLQAEIRPIAGTDRLTFRFVEPNREGTTLSIANKTGVPLIDQQGQIALSLVISLANGQTRAFGTRLVSVVPDTSGALIVKTAPNENDSFGEAVEDIVNNLTTLKWSEQPKQITVTGSARFGDGPFIDLDGSITIPIAARDVVGASYREPAKLIRLPSPSRPIPSAVQFAH